MKYLILAFTFFAPLVVMGQTTYNTSGGWVADGYDVVTYFAETAREGKKEFSTTFEGAKFRFSSETNLQKFKSNPEKYAPQYGGYCAYAMGKGGEKVDIDAKTYEIRDGQLFLFYNAFFNNTLEKWQKEDPEKLKNQADINWEKLNQK